MSYIFEGGGVFRESPSHNTSTGPMSLPGVIPVTSSPGPYKGGPHSQMRVPQSQAMGYPQLGQDGVPLGLDWMGTPNQDWMDYPPPHPPG